MFLSTQLIWAMDVGTIAAAYTSEVKDEIEEEALEEDKSAEELAKQLANPIAALISLPFQLNYDRGYYHSTGDDSNKWTLNIQPVVPISLNEDWNLISRTIVPIVRMDNTPPGNGIESGVGDIVQSLFLSPALPTENGWVWGIGPVFLIPTDSDNISARKWGVGPTAVALKQDGPLTYGVLANHLWSIAGEDIEDDNGNVLNDISQTFVQPFFSYTTSEAITVTTMMETTYNWNATNGNEWSVPIFLMVSKVDKIGGQLVNYAGGVKYYAQSPDGGAEGWGARIVFTFLFPK
ncbi:transporter [Hydrogenimonas cancrithermarum]|nr:transporter [Hydrogenimonas cancrithermarum]